MEASDLVLTFLANALWQAALVLAVAAACAGALRGASMAQRHAIWSAALFSAVLLPLISILPTHATETTMTPVEALESVQPVGPPAVPLAPVPGAAVSTLYAVLLVWGIGRLAVAGYGVRSIRRSAFPRPLTPAMLAADEVCRAATGLPPIPVLCSTRIGGPLTVGDREPIIVLPESLWQETSAEVICSVIGHEMAHIVRRDYLMKVFVELLFLPIAFHPAAWILRRRVDQTRELACDEAVTREIIDASAYTQSLIDVARSVALFRKPAHSLGVLDGDILEKRVRNLLKPGRRFHSRTAAVALLACVAVLWSAASLASGHAVAIATYSRLSGRVFDQSGAAVPAATVTLTDLRTGLKYSRATSEFGSYEFDSLPVGQFSLAAGKRGFARFQRTKVDLGRDHRINPVLSIGMVSETLTVSAQ